MTALNNGERYRVALTCILELEEEYTPNRLSLQCVSMLEPHALALVCKPWKEEVSRYILGQLTLIHPPLGNNPNNIQEFENAKAMFMDCVKTYKLFAQGREDFIFGPLSIISKNRFTKFNQKIEEKKLRDIETVVWNLSQTKIEVKDLDRYKEDTRD